MEQRAQGRWKWVRKLLFGDWTPVLRDPLDLLRLSFAVASVGFLLTGHPAIAWHMFVDFLIVVAAGRLNMPRLFDLLFILGWATQSWGNAAGLFNLKRDRGIYRPALALPIPRPGGEPVIVLDVGANVTCRPEHLVQFAHMGSAFAQAVMGVESPRVALLSNGAEPTKGTSDLIEVHALLALWRDV